PEEKAYAETSIPLNASENENILKWWYVLDDSGVLTFNKSNESVAQSVLNTTEGAHRLKVYGIDLANNTNSSACNFTVDTKAPRIIIISPENGSEFEIKDGGSEYTVDLNVSLSESCYFSYRVGSAPFSKTVSGNKFNETLKLGAGSYDITLRAEDEAGNLGRNYTSIKVWGEGSKPDAGLLSYDGGGRRRFDRVLAALLARMGSDEGNQGDDAGDGGALELTPMLKNEEFSPVANNSKVKDKDSIFSTTNAGILLLTTALLILFIKYMMYFRREK
ncbi:MAG: hypothetical protein PHV51_07770, partial [Methanosarcinaceae archaeon]|nr:hypothetical protein [Methanosarcinaceae archaeon]